MSEQQTTEEAATETSEETTTETKPTETVEFWKQKAREQEKRAKANADAATKLAELEESQKTETQRLSDQLAAEKAQREQAEQQALRYRVATAKGLPADLVDRLQGDTEDDLSADADALLRLLSDSNKSGNHVPREGANHSQPAEDEVSEFARNLFESAEQ